MENDDGEAKFDFLAYKRTLNEAQGIAAIQSKESIKVDGKNIFPYQYENGGFTEIRVRKESKDETESLQLDMQGEEVEFHTKENGRISRLGTPLSPMRSPNILIDNGTDEVQNRPQAIPLTISAVKLLPIRDSLNEPSFDEMGEPIEIANKPVKTGNSEYDIQMSPNRTKIVGGGGVIMRTTSPRIRTHHRRKSSSNGPKFLDFDSKPVRSDIRLDLMVSSIANMKLNQKKKKRGRNKKHSSSKRSKSRGTPSPHRRDRGDPDEEMTSKHKSRKSKKNRDRTLVTFEDKRTVLDVETMQDRHHETYTPIPHSEQHPQEGLKMPRELKKKKSLSDLGKSQAIDVSVDDEYGV